MPKRPPHRTTTTAAAAPRRRPATTSTPAAPRPGYVQLAPGHWGPPGFEEAEQWKRQQAASQEP